MFRRNGADIHSDLLISIAQAVLGGTARCQGLYETINITVSTMMRKSLGTVLCGVAEVLQSSSVCRHHDPGFFRTECGEFVPCLVTPPAPLVCGDW